MIALTFHREALETAKPREPEHAKSRNTIMDNIGKVHCRAGSLLKGFDDSEILYQARRHGISPLLNAQAQGGTITGISNTLAKQLKSEAHSYAASDMLQNFETAKLLDLLAKDNIPALLLKGTPVASLYYPNTYLRPRCDTDIYFDQGDLERLTKLLSAHRYKLSGVGAREHSSKQFVATIEAMRQNYFNFDMHWKLSNRVMFRSTLPFYESHESSQPVPSLGANAKTLSTIDLMIHACIHRIAHGRNSESNRLIWLYDIHLLAKAMNDVNGKFSDSGPAKIHRVPVRRRAGGVPEYIWHHAARKRVEYFKRGL